MAQHELAAIYGASNLVTATMKYKDEGMLTLCNSKFGKVWTYLHFDLSLKGVMLDCFACHRGLM